MDEEAEIKKGSRLKTPMIKKEYGFLNIEHGTWNAVIRNNAVEDSAESEPGCKPEDSSQRNHPYGCLSRLKAAS